MRSRCVGCDSPDREGSRCVNAERLKGSAPDGRGDRSRRKPGEHRCGFVEARRNDCSEDDGLNCFASRRKSKQFAFVPIFKLGRNWGVLVAQAEALGIFLCRPGRDGVYRSGSQTFVQTLSPKQNHADADKCCFKVMTRGDLLIRQMSIYCLSNM